MSFSNATPAGIYFQNKVKLNPDADLVIGKDDYVILLEEDDGIYDYHEIRKCDESSVVTSLSEPVTAGNHLIIVY